MDNESQHNHKEGERGQCHCDLEKSILRQRLSSTSSDSGIGSPPNYFTMDKMMDDFKMANPNEPIPLHWRVIPMPWK